MIKKNNKKKTWLDLVAEVRKSWSINPRTRVQENKLKDKKKQRQEAHKLSHGINKDE